MEPEHPGLKLRCQLLGHQQDVRCACVGEIGIITGSRDATIKVWAEESPTAYALRSTLTGAKNYVGAVAYAPPGFLPGLPNGAIISGTFDGLVMVWDVATGAPAHTYSGHKYQAAGVAVLPTGDIASASVDMTVRLWREGRCAGVAEGHTGPVLCLAVLEGGDLISGSGDTTIKRWQGTKCVATYKGHTDTVRGLAALPGVGFVSGSHDCSLRVWSLDGTTLAEMHGHTAIIYSVAAAGSSGLIASGSEDNTVRLWSSAGACLQVLDHPGCVWAVAFTPAGDLVSGCSDAVGRVWSSSQERQADAEAQAAYSALIEQRKAAAAEEAAAKQAEAEAAAGGGAAPPGLPPGVKVCDAHELLQPGAKDGETKIVREADGSIAAYGWSVAGASWDKIGVVVDAPEPGSVSTGRRWYAGREWDRVFDVEMDSGLKLKLALDDGENPYLVADRFLEQHDLPPEFKEQVVKFILDNTSTGSSRGALDMPITGGFCDPFTGSSGSGQPQASASASNRPPPAAAMQPMSITGGFCDPFTGGAGAQQQPSTSSPKQVPARVALLFDAPPPPEALRKKLLEFNAALAASPNSCADGAISEAEAAPGGLLDQLLAGLAAAAAGRDDASGGPTAEQIALAARLLRWPAAQAFPGLDVARCLVLHPRAAAQAAANAGSMAAPVLGSLSGALAAAAVSGASPAQQMALRLAVNCFKEPALRGWVCGQRELLLDGFAGAGSSGPGASKGVRLGLATLLLNFAVAGGAAGMDEAGGMQLLSAVDELLGATPPEEGQAVHRALLALGTLLMGPHATALKSVAGDLGVGGLVSRWAGVGGEVGAAAGEVAALLN